MAYEFIKVDRTDGVLMITMHDPATRNSLSTEMQGEMRQELDRFERDLDDRVLLLTGTEPSFCSGANVKRMDQSVRERDARERETPPEDDADAMPWGKVEMRLGVREDPGDGTFQVGAFPLRIHKLQKPSIAAVNGHAYGVGMGVSLACDIRLASEKAVFSEAFVLRGLIPGDGSCWQLPRMIGLSNTFLLQYTGDRIDGNEAYRMNLVSKVYPDDELMPAAMELATRLAGGPTVAMSLTKYLVQKGLHTDLEESMATGHVTQMVARRSEDHKEAARAFVEKRKPAFKGR